MKIVPRRKNWSEWLQELTILMFKNDIDIWNYDMCIKLYDKGLSPSYVFLIMQQIYNDKMVS